MNLKWLTRYFAPIPPKPVKVSQKGIQARAIRHLIANGRITARDVLDMGTNDTGKMFSRLRRMGLLFDSEDACGHRWDPNRSGRGRHKVHYWTRKYPLNWNWVGPDCREKSRGKK